MKKCVLLLVLLATAVLGFAQVQEFGEGDIWRFDPSEVEINEGVTSLWKFMKNILTKFTSCLHMNQCIH
jgi:hypothetical protein